MSDRLKDLQRQRELAREQQERLDREIAREMAAASTPAAPPPPEGTVASADADKIIAQYSQGQRPIRDQVKSGCLVYFFAAFALVGLAIALLYLLHDGR